jgi:hypothetical protein
MDKPRLATITDEDPHELYKYFNKHFHLTYDKFREALLDHPKSLRELFFILKSNDGLIGASPYRKARIHGCNLDVVFAGYNFVLSKYQGKGLMKVLRFKAYEELQDNFDMLMIPQMATSAPSPFLFVAIPQYTG